jgi:hypothetical protein
MSEHDEAQARQLEQTAQRKKRGYKPGGPAGRMIVTSPLLFTCLIQPLGISATVFALPSRAA